MSYVQPENSNRVNSIKQKFESPTTDADISAEKKCSANDKTKESLCRTLSASPIAPRKNLKLNVTRQLSNPSRNIKRSPAFRGDKLSRTKNLNSPTKEKIVSLVDKNVKLFEDKPEYGKLGNVKKKSMESTAANASEEEEFGIVYDDVESIMLIDNCGNGSVDLRNKSRDNTVGYGKILPGNNGESKNSRSQSLDRLYNKQTCLVDSKERKDSVRTTVISRHKNISAITGDGDHLKSVSDYPKSGVSYRNELVKTDDEASSLKLDKFLKNGVEYTKVMKTKRIDNGTSIHNSDDEKDELPDIREELSRRKYGTNKTNEQFTPSIESDSYKRAKRMSKNLSDDDRFPKFATNGDEHSSQSKLDFVPVKDIILKDKRDNVRENFNNELTDTLKAALKAPLPSGPPPKKPPRTFAHSPTANRSPVDDYEEVDGFWQKKQKFQTDETTLKNTALESLDIREEKIHSFLHDVGSKQLRRSLRNKSRETEGCHTFAANKILTRDENSGEDFKEQGRNYGVPLKLPNLDSHLYRIKECNRSSLNSGKKLIENSLEYEPINTSANSRDINLSRSLSKLDIDSREKLDFEERVVDSVSGLRRSLSPADPVNVTASSEENSSASPLNISYSPQKFKISPVRSSNSGRSRTNKDSKEMLDKLEHVLIQHQKACGPKVIIPRTDKFDLGIGSSQCETEPRNNVSRHREIFQKRLSRTLEEGKKLGPLPSLPDEPEKSSRNLGFDCLPSLNCAGNSSIYERIQNPDFRTYLTDINSSGALERSENFYSKCGVSPPQNSLFYLDNGTENSTDFLKPDPYDTAVISPASKRLSNELTTFSDAKKQINNVSKKVEPVYAEPFTFDTNFSTDITMLESGTSTPRNERRFRSNKKEDNPMSLKKGGELHYMVRRARIIQIMLKVWKNLVCHHSGDHWH